MGMKKVLLIFFLDAVRYDYINPVDAPFLYKLAKKGVSGPLQTILGFDGIAPTIFTGTYPDVHGVWTQHLLAQEDGTFNWIAPFSSLFEEVDQAIERFNLLWKAFRFVILKASLLKGRRSFYPGINKVPISALPRFDFSMKRNLYEKNAFGSTPTLFDLLRENGITFSVADHPAFGSDQSVVKRVSQMKNPSEVVYVRLMDLDEITHSYGVFSSERKNGLRALDRALHTIVSYFEHNGLNPFVVIFADHGFVDVSCYIDIMHHLQRNGLVEGEDFIVFLDSTMARFWGDDSILSKISHIVTGLRTGRILTDMDLRKYHVPRRRGYGDLVYLADPSVVILPNYYQGNSKVLGMHGYAPATPEMNTILILYQKGITPRKIWGTKLVDVLPTMLDILEISKPEHCVGISRLSE
jgi:predicted AlkP superfamily pyrophosphatase or phosphodiesterase